MSAKAAALADAYPSRTRQRLETRDRIFVAALAEFRRAGVAEAQIEDIVRAAGVARGTFYLHFPSKDQVLMELLRRRQAAVSEALSSAEPRSVLQFLRATVDLVVDDLAGEDVEITRELFAMIPRNVTEAERGDALVTALTVAFDAGQGRGEVRRDLASSDLAVLFLTGMFGLLVLKIEAPTSELRETLHQAAHVFARGIAA